VDVDPDVWPVTVDPVELETALVNLVVNARDAMPSGGTVTIRAANTAIEDGDANGDYVAIEVEDTGLGIPPDVLSRVFDPFFTTKPVGKGTGLGLSQVHGFAHQAGGSVTVTSELGKGTVFTICLPRGGGVTAAARHETNAAGAGTVLLVEDNPDVATASAGLLEQLGYSVRWVSEAETALQEVDRNGIDLVLTDIVMPGAMDGLGLARAIRQKHPGMPIILATGYSHAALSGHSDFSILRKPYQLHELSQALSRRSQPSTTRG
jgi:CheY-like chemotaxis protein/anti-sigma regulatory factor (Ser/Thr protein kinase)